MQKDQEKITNFLVKKFELREGEVELYLELLRLQSATVLKLSQSTGMNRITAHGYVNNLVKKGLITQTKRGSRRVLVPESPEKLEQILDEKKRELQDLESTLPDVINALKEFVPEKRSRISVDFKYYEGKNAVASIYKEMAKADEVYSFVNIDKFWEAFPEPEMHQLLLEAFEKNKKHVVKDIAIDTPFARKNAVHFHERYQCKFFPKSSQAYEFDILMYDDKVVLMQLVPENMFATKIRSEHIAQSLKLIFNSMWQLLPTPVLSESVNENST
jgi:sugar-specific transcriptional regulator TrmB